MQYRLRCVVMVNVVLPWTFGSTLVLIHTARCWRISSFVRLVVLPVILWGGWRDDGIVIIVSVAAVIAITITNVNMVDGNTYCRNNTWPDACINYTFRRYRYSVCGSMFHFEDDEISIIAIDLSSTATHKVWLTGYLRFSNYLATDKRLLDNVKFSDEQSIIWVWPHCPLFIYFFDR